MSATVPRGAASPAVHSYAAELSWSGSTAAGYDGYDRAHDVRCAPARAALALSADVPFRGDPELLNPEQLLVAAAASCQLLSFLAVAARARIDVREYRDQALGTMDESERPARIGRIELCPHIVVAPGPSEERVRALCELAHRECYIASSLNSEVVVDPRIEFAGDG